MVSRPPKGYNAMDKPLPHNFNYKFGLNIDSGTTKGATYLPLILNDEGLVNADTVNVNPKHGSFAESNNPYCHQESIIPRMGVTIKATLSKIAIETDKIRQLNFSWMPVYTSFLNRLEAQDSKTSVQVEDILELQHETVGKSTYPIWGGKLSLAPAVGIHASATTAFMGMTTNANLELIAFDRELFFDALQYYTNAEMLKKVIGRTNNVTLTRDRNYFYHSNNFTHPTVKRINPYTFCGILFYSGKEGSTDQLLQVGDATSVDHIIVQAHIRYDEWNNSFDQTPS